MEARGRRHISRDVKKTILRMACHMHTREIVVATGISRRSIGRVQHLWNTTGDVVKKSILVGRPRVLDALDTEVSNISCDLSLQ